MVKHIRIKAGEKKIDAVLVKLQAKNLVLLRGSKGYVMCGYLNLSAAEKFGDAAVKIKGISTINQAIKTVVHSCTGAAKKLGVSVGQPIKDVLRLIA